MTTDIIEDYLNRAPCDACGDYDKPLTLWRKRLPADHMDAGQWHTIALCDDCAKDGPDMVVFERAEED